MALSLFVGRMQPLCERLAGGCSRLLGKNAPGDDGLELGDKRTQPP